MPPPRTDVGPGVDVERVHPAALALRHDQLPAALVDQDAADTAAAATAAARGKDIVLKCSESSGG